MTERLLHRSSRLRLSTERLVVVFDRRKAVARCPCRHDMEMDETLRPLGKGIEIQRLPVIGRFVVGEKPFAADLRQKLDARSAEQLLKRDREMLCFRLIGIGKTPVHRFSRLIHLDMDDIDGHRTLPDRCPQHLQVDLVLHRFPPYGTHKKSMYKFFLLYMPAQKKENEKDPSATLGMTIRKGPPHSFSSRLGSEPPPLRGTSFRGKEGVCRLLASSFRAKARNLFRLRSGKRGEDDGSREAPHSLRRGITVLHANSFTKENGNGKRKRSLDCARDDNTGEGCLTFPFIPRRE